VVPHTTVPDWMAAADVLALVSRREPLGQVALEALASGRPVVGTSVGGTPEVVPGTGPGRIVDPGHPGAIADALLDVIRRPPSPGQCRAAARPFALASQAAAVERVLAASVAGGRA
jgi:glycosyltransferase involved in cell wall biosynthesis